MTLALYIIGSSALLLWLSAKLSAAHEEIARMRGESQTTRDEYSAYAHGVTVSLACLLVALAAASRYAPRKGTGE
jgi:hypothetical protein